MNDFYRSLPKKRMAAGCLLFDAHGHLLLLKQQRSLEWDLPGGIVEQNESPKQCCRREVIEEIGLELEVGNLLVVEYVSARQEKTEGIVFLFDGGSLSQNQIDQISPQVEEIAAFHFFPLDQLPPEIPPNRRRRILAALAQRNISGSAYLET
jgi:8-oxo-dGTP pyrophosphatase MutT (NUDIX family)